MQYKTLNEYKEELHPWPIYIPTNATKLILGTFPTADRNRGSYQFYYPNPNNDFWNIIFSVAQKKLSDYGQAEPVEIRKQILTELGLGIGDIGKRVLRQRNSSKDGLLFPIEYADIFSVLELHPQIDKIIITSSSGGNSVLSWFSHYCSLNGVNFKVPKEKLPIQTTLLLNYREIKVEVISSTSRISPIRGEKLFEMYRTAILNA